MNELLPILLSFFMLIVTCIYVYFTMQLVKETTKMREAETSPFINARLLLEQGFSKIVVENIGKSPAYDLQIEFEEEVFKEIKLEFYKTYSSNISYFGVGQYLDINFNTKEFIELNKDIVLTVKYSSIDNKNFSETIWLNIGAEKDLGGFYPKKEYEDEFKNMISELKKIGENLKNS